MTWTQYSLFAAAVALVSMTALPKLALASPCEQTTFEETKYVICTLEPGKTDLRLFWQNADGHPWRYFPRVARQVADGGKTLTFAMNAGMYQPDFSPLGLYVENGEELRPVNTNSVEGPPAKIPNFYKKPNGVFFLDENGAGVLPTEEFLKERPKVRFATQSGPMLVINNQLHPAFIVGSTDRTRRSGVGVCEDGMVRMAISDDDVNFHDFARLFRDHLKCTNALFLDGGNGVGIYSPDLGRSERSWHGGFGPILGIVE